VSRRVGACLKKKNKRKQRAWQQRYPDEVKRAKRAFPEVPNTEGFLIRAKRFLPGERRCFQA
jgi:hypothetical protein